MGSPKLKLEVSAGSSGLPIFALPVDSAKEPFYLHLQCIKGVTMNSDKSEVLQGTLDLMILKSLQALGPQHGFGIARRIE